MMLGEYIAMNVVDIKFPEERKVERVWFTSDTHFGHKNILRFCPQSRPVASIEEHDERLIANWQAQVAPQDRVYHLGDMFFCNVTRARTIMEQLPGRIHLIYGNHDRVIQSNSDLRGKFEAIHDYKEIRLDDIKVCLFHFPIHEWHQVHRGSFHLYGHVHGSVTLPGRAMDVGIDSRPDGDMLLWSWEEVKARLITRQHGVHHGNTFME